MKKNLRNNTIYWAIFLIGLFFIFTPHCFASSDVLINEFVPKGDQEWVEIFNSGPTEVNLAGWSLKDKAQSPKSLDSLGIIKAGGLGVYYNAKGWLNDSGDKITLKNDQDKLIDEIIYGNESGSIIKSPKQGKSGARTPDGEDWKTDINSTPGSSNPLPPSPSPSPSPSLSPSPSSSLSESEDKSSPSPSLSPSLSPNSALQNSPLPSPSLKSSTLGLTTQKKEDRENDDFTGEVFGAQESSEEATESGDEKEEEEKKKFRPSLPLIISLTGGLFLAGSSFPFLKPKIIKLIQKLKKR